MIWWSLFAGIVIHGRISTSPQYPVLKIDRALCLTIKHHPQVQIYSAPISTYSFIITHHPIIQNPKVRCITRLDSYRLQSWGLKSPSERNLSANPTPPLFSIPLFPSAQSLHHPLLIPSHAKQRIAKLPTIHLCIFRFQYYFPPPHSALSLHTYPDSSPTNKPQFHAKPKTRFPTFGFHYSGEISFRASNDPSLHSLITVLVTMSLIRISPQHPTTPSIFSTPAHQPITTIGSIYES